MLLEREREKRETASVAMTCKSTRRPKTIHQHSFRSDRARSKAPSLRSAVRCGAVQCTALLYSTLAARRDATLSAVAVCYCCYQYCRHNKYRYRYFAS